ncbi:isocitrate/isopropylmalate dehydrogenase family protein [Candidatus Woesearchaeota archaeon]|nr:isocitrate/isopropylmalate dehydrogenase family protein [Candidatus Woesearchaeota archaeon]
MKYKIAVFPGDGVGPELINEGIKVIEKAAELDKFIIECVKYPNGTEHYLETKELLNEKILKEIKANCNAVYCGTFDNSVKEINGIRSLIRDYFDHFVCLRPIKLLPSVESLIAGKTHEDIDFILIRENTEDFYVGTTGRAKNGKNRNQHEISNSAFKAKFSVGIETKGSEIAYQIGILSKRGCERIIRFAFEYAKNKNKKITAVDKANVIEAYNFWRENVEKVAQEYKGTDYEFNLIDAAVMNFIRQPEKYQVIVAPNMFGDILSDLGTMLQGGLAFAAQGNINPEGISMFEPIHGCAAKLKGQGIVNPIATIWAGALMLENLGQKESSELIIKAIETVLKEGRTRTQDLDGHNTTSEMGDAIVDKLVEIHD